MSLPAAHPTSQTYSEIEQAFEFFNKELFDGRLPHCLLTLQRQHDTYGYFSASQFLNRDSGEVTHEIALNPIYFAVRSIPETLSVLVREMVTLDQLLNTKGKLPRRRYRNREWADMVEAIGLMPTDTGQPGGKRVGDSVETYIIDGGLFDLACSQLANDAFTLSWVDRYPPAEGVSDPAAVVEESHAGAAPASIAFAQTMSSGVAASDALADESQILGNSGSPFDVEFVDGLDVFAAQPPLPSVTGIDAAIDAGSSLVAGADEATAGAVDSLVSAAPPMKRYEQADMAALKTLGVQPKEKSTNISKSKFSCAECGANVWGKPSLNIHCAGAEGKEHSASRMVSV